MSYNEDHYRMDKNGFYNKEEAERAVDNGHLQKLSNGRYYDRETKQEYWQDGTKKNGSFGW